MLKDLGLFSLEKAQGESHQCVQIPEGRVQRKWGQALFSGVQDKRQWAQTETQQVPAEYKQNIFYCEGDQTLEERGCEISVVGDLQKSYGCGPGQVALGVPAWTR